MSGGQWEHFPHGADIGVRGLGPSLEEAFAEAALALTAAIADPATVAPLETVHLDIPGSDPEFLLVDWLNALVFEMAARGMLFGRFRLGRTADGLSAEIAGEPVDRARHQPAVEVKGATMTELAVDQLADGTWRAQCVIDV